MKNLKYLLIALLGLSVFASCDDDTGITVPDDAIAPVLTSTNSGTFVLKKVEEKNDFQTFEWSEADFKIAVAPEYTLEVAAKDTGFANANVVANGIKSPFTISVGDFNKALLAAGFTDSETHEIEVRVVAGNYLASASAPMTVTTYFDAEPYSIIGSAVGGWGTENDQFMDYDKTTDTYSLTLDMNPGEFKFRAPVKDKSNPWAFNYGLVGDGITIDNGENIALEQDGSNIKTSGGNYTITLSVTGLTFSIKQNSAASYTDWSAAKLDAVGDGVSTDNANATADGSSWGWGNVLVADNNGLPTKDGAVYTWKWEGIVLEADAGFKLRTLNGEAASNGIPFDVDFAAIDTENSSDKVADVDGNITVTEKGAYDIIITIDAANGDLKKVVVADPAPLYPTELYMIGDGVGDWDWANTDLPMVPVNGTPNQFWKIVWLNETGSFKFSPQKSWEGNDFGAVETEFPAGGEFNKGGENLVVPGTAGYYMVVVDLDTEKISVVEPTVYLIGDAFGSWDAANADGLFTVDNANEKITITKTLTAGNLRMYAAHSYFPSGDWWRTEFMILDGAIVPRANGGDQDPVSVTGVETTIDLIFKDMTGTITQ